MGSSDYIRAYARDVGLDPEINGHDNVQDAIAAGSGGSFPDFTGSGSPEGVQTANVGQSYVDTTNGALYFKLSGAATNTGWALGSNVLTAIAGTLPTVGFLADGGGDLQLLAPDGAGVLIGDGNSQQGLGNGLRYLGGADGSQSWQFTLGTAGQFDWTFAADGSTHFPGPAGFNGSSPPAKAATPILLADVILILQNLGFCS